MTVVYRWEVRDPSAAQDGAGRFAFFVPCKSCSSKTDNVRTAGVAVKLWNEATPLR